VLAARPEAAVTYLGTGVDAAQVVSAHAAAVRHRVTVVESYDRGELPALLADHHVVVSASLAEGFSLALPEAMACGLAPVVTALDGAREIVRDGVNGRLVPPADPGALERALVETLADRDALQRLRIAAHATAQEYGWDQVAASQLALYGRLARP
jgi:glycosyltransferase involved in cell wall biosynthesis